MQSMWLCIFSYRPFQETYENTKRRKVKQIQPIRQCTMGKFKNGVKSSQLWQIISLWILAQNLPNLAQSCLNSPKTQINTYISNKYFANEEKIQKTCWGCLHKLRLVSKKLSPKEFVFIQGTFWKNTPQYKKMGSKSET